MSDNTDSDPLTISLRKFLRQVGVTSQRAIEEAASEARRNGKGRMTVRAVITAEGTSLNHVVEAELDLE